jgi:hypothetical protein
LEGALGRERERGRENEDNSGLLADVFFNGSFLSRGKQKETRWRLLSLYSAWGRERERERERERGYAE